MIPTRHIGYAHGYLLLVADRGKVIVEIIIQFVEEDYILNKELLAVPKVEQNLSVLYYSLGNNGSLRMGMHGHQHGCKGNQCYFGNFHNFGL